MITSLSQKNNFQVLLELNKRLDQGRDLSEFVPLNNVKDIDNGGHNADIPSPSEIDQGSKVSVKEVLHNLLTKNHCFNKCLKKQCVFYIGDYGYEYEKCRFAKLRKSISRPAPSNKKLAKEMLAVYLFGDELEKLSLDELLYRKY